MEKRHPPGKKRNNGPLFFYFFSLFLTFGLFYLAFHFSSWEGETKSAQSQENSLQMENSTAPAQGSAGNWVEFVSLPEDAFYQGPLILVNQRYGCYQEEIPDLLSVYENKNSSYMVSDKNVLLHKDTIQALNEMLLGFQQSQGSQDLLVCSGYRTLDYQDDLLSREEQEKGSQAAAGWVASPGHSEHHTGYALDFNIFHPSDGTSESYTGTGVYRWINENAPRFGFIVRYPEEKYAYTGIQYEPWHFRYVGLPHSLIIQEHEFCLEEYIFYLDSFTAQGEHLFYTDPQGKQYEIYTVNNTENIPIGSNKSYTISGDNTGRCIVTLFQ